MLIQKNCGRALSTTRLPAKAKRLKEQTTGFVTIFAKAKMRAKTYHPVIS